MSFSPSGRNLVVALLLAAAGCAINPVSGRPDFVLVSTEQEKKMGAEEAKKVEQQVGLIDDQALTEYVAAVGARLAAHSPRQDVTYTFYVVDVPEPNAFALPGGYVYVTRGLLALVNSEDELACVIGHEIGHVAARHSVKQVSRSAPFAIVTGLSSAIVGIASPLLGDLVGGVGSLASSALLTPFSRDQEREADRIGQRLAAASGWDPAAMSTFLATLQREETLRGASGPRFAFLSTHPSTPERVANTNEYARGLTRVAEAPISADRAAFLQRLDGLVYGENAANGIFDDNRFLHPDLDFGISFPQGWKTQNGRAQVAAMAPDRGAVAFLQTVGSGDDPMEGARAMAAATKAPVVERTQPLKIGDLAAARTYAQANTESGEVGITVTWIAYRGAIYQVTGVAPAGRFESYRARLDGVAESFAPLNADERVHIRENRVRIATAEASESLASLAKRTNSAWEPAMIAVANGIPDGAALTAGEPLKVTRWEAYRK
jgi:predicted Zn-dependent protease